MTSFTTCEICTWSSAKCVRHAPLQYPDRPRLSSEDAAALRLVDDWTKDQIDRGYGGAFVVVDDDGELD